MLRSIIHSLPLLFTLCCCVTLSGQVPYVYGVENTGASCAPVTLPQLDELPNYPLLPDPFAWSDGSGRSTDFADWPCRRNEIMAEISRYEIGPKPQGPEDMVASFTNDTLRVVVTVGGESLTLESPVTIPEGEGPFPVVIGMRNPTGSLPAQLFEGVITIPFYHDQVVTYSQTSNRVPGDPYYDLYPGLTEMGNYSAWSWGISRLIDGVMAVRSQMNADVEHIGVTGCSYAGKMALFAGAYDERIALTIVQESGGGGINSWRTSEWVAEEDGEQIEKIDNTNYSWFMQSMRDEFAGRVGTLPHDHHELMALIAPRALLVLGNPDFVWLGDKSGYISARATEEVYRTFGIEDRFGFSFRPDHNHCQLPDASYPEVQAFVDKFLFEATEVNTDVAYHEFFDVDYERWFEAWSEPANPNAPSVSLVSVAGDSVHEAPATISFTATVVDPNGDVERVDFFNGLEKIGEVSDSPYEFTWAGVRAGNYFISVEAVDSAGLKGFSNVINVVVRSPVVKTYKVPGGITIDGVKEPVWDNDNVTPLSAENELVGNDLAGDDLAGNVRVLWNDDNLYIFARVSDESLQNDSPNTYEDDNVEIYVDPNNSKGGSYDGDDVQYSFAWNDGAAVGALPASRPVTDIEYQIVDTDAGYDLEASIPWATLGASPADRMEIGFDFMVNDDDDGGGRDAKISWNATEDQAWQNPSLFGTISLVATQVVSSTVAREQEALMLYPNPSAEYLYVKGVKTPFDYEIIDASGKVLSRGNNDSGKIAVGSLPAGNYYLKIVTEDKRATSLKFVR